jgi:hypothetical protein
LYLLGGGERFLWVEAGILRLERMWVNELVIVMVALDGWMIVS